VGGPETAVTHFVEGVSTFQLGGVHAPLLRGGGYNSSLPMVPWPTTWPLAMLPGYSRPVICIVMSENGGV